MQRRRYTSTAFAGGGAEKSLAQMRDYVLATGYEQIRAFVSTVFGVCIRAALAIKAQGSELEESQRVARLTESKADLVAACERYIEALKAES